MKSIFILIAALLLVSCGKKEYLTVEEVVRQCMVCDSAGLFPEVHHNLSNTRVISVTCEVYRIKSTLPDYAKIKSAAQTKDSTALRITGTGQN